MFNEFSEMGMSKFKHILHVIMMSKLKLCDFLLHCLDEKNNVKQNMLLQSIGKYESLQLFDCIALNIDKRLDWQIVLIDKQTDRFIYWTRKIYIVKCYNFGKSCNVKQ